MDNDIVGRGIAGGVNNFFQTLANAKAQQRQEGMDALTLRRLALDEKVKQASLNDAAAQQGALQQVYNTATPEEAYAAKMKAEIQAKKHADFFDHIDKLKRAGASPQFITTWAKQILAKDPDTAPMAPDISFIDDKVIKIAKDFGDNQLPDPTQPGKFMPAGKYEVEGQATGDPINPYKFTTVKPFIDKESLLDKRLEQQSELQDKRQAAADARLDKTLAASDRRQERTLSAMAARTAQSQAAPDDVATLANQVINLQLDPYNISKRGGLQSKVFAAIERLSPGFNLNEAASNYKVMSNPNIRKSVMILDSIEPMLDTLQEAHKKLNLSSYPILNKAKVAALRQTGDPDIVAFDNLRNNIVLEVTNAMQGSSQMSDARVKMEADNLTNAQSPAQMRAAIENIKDVILTRKGAFKKPAFENPAKGKKADPLGIR